MVDSNEGISKPSPLEILRDWRFMAVSSVFLFFLVTEKKNFHDYAFCVAHPFAVTGILLLVFLFTYAATASSTIQTYN